MSILDRVYAGLEDDTILFHIDRCAAANFDLSALDWHLQGACWERLEVLTNPGRS